MKRYVVTCMEKKTGRTFEKEFEIYDEMRKFIIKCNYSKRIKVISYVDRYGGVMNEYC